MSSTNKGQWRARRKRGIVRKAYFTREEWEQVEQRMARLRAAAPNMTWQDYSNRIARHGSIRLIEVPYDPHRMLALLSSIASSINQIARKANTQGGVTREELDRLSVWVARCVGATKQLAIDWDRAYQSASKDPKEI